MCIYFDLLLFAPCLVLRSSLLQTPLTQRTRGCSPLLSLSLQELHRGRLKMCADVTLGGLSNSATVCAA